MLRSLAQTEVDDVVEAGKHGGKSEAGERMEVYGFERHGTVLAAHIVGCDALLREREEYAVRGRYTDRGTELRADRHGGRRVARAPSRQREARRDVDGDEVALVVAYQDKVAILGDGGCGGDATWAGELEIELDGKRRAGRCVRVVAHRPERAVIVRVGRRRTSGDED